MICYMTKVPKWHRLQASLALPLFSLHSSPLPSSGRGPAYLSYSQAAKNRHNCSALEVHFETSWRSNKITTRATGEETETRIRARLACARGRGRMRGSWSESTGTGTATAAGTGNSGAVPIIQHVNAEFKCMPWHAHIFIHAHIYTQIHSECSLSLQSVFSQALFITGQPSIEMMTLVMSNGISSYGNARE